MRYAKVVVGLPVQGPFDYIVPGHLEKKIKEGMRVWVSFGAKKKMVGYVVGLSASTGIKNLKTLSEAIDDYPILNKKMLSLTKKLADYYCCSWGEAIETALPEALRKGSKTQGLSPNGDCPCAGNNASVVLVHGLFASRWDMYINYLKEAIDNNKSAIVLLPDIDSVFKAKEIIQARVNCFLGVVYRKQPQELVEWMKIKSAKFNVIVGTRSAVFAPLNNPGLIIIDEEEDSAYKQDQVPHYHAAKIAWLRADTEKAKLILGSTSPSLENIYLSGNHKIQDIPMPGKKAFPEIRIVDMKNLAYADKKRNIIFAKFLADSIYSVLSSKGKILLFLNRKGFATLASCQNCQITLKCPRCDINLNYHFKENILNCHYCNFKMPPPRICPQCKSGYIRYSGTGTEKIESELARLYPQAKIKRWDSPQDTDFQDADIIVAASAIIKQTNLNFDLIGVLSIDNSLNRVDFRAGEKTFAILTGLLGLTGKTMVIQTGLPHHHCFQALLKNDADIFYDEELKQRRQLKFPPYKHLILVKLRGKKEERVEKIASLLFERLNSAKRDKGIKIVSVNPGQLSKLRGNFYWQVLVRCDNIPKTNEFLKINLKDFPHSGIIVTVDVDPV